MQRQLRPLVDAATVASSILHKGQDLHKDNGKDKGQGQGLAEAVDVKDMPLHQWAVRSMMLGQLFVMQDPRQGLDGDQGPGLVMSAQGPGLVQGSSGPGPGLVQGQGVEQGVGVGVNGIDSSRTEARVPMDIVPGLGPGIGCDSAKGLYNDTITSSVEAILALACSTNSSMSSLIACIKTGFHRGVQTGLQTGLQRGHINQGHHVNMNDGVAGVVLELALVLLRRVATTVVAYHTVHASKATGGDAINAGAIDAGAGAAKGGDGIKIGGGGNGNGNLGNGVVRRASTQTMSMNRAVMVADALAHAVLSARLDESKNADGQGLGGLDNGSEKHADDNNENNNNHSNKNNNNDNSRSDGNKWPTSTYNIRKHILLRLAISPLEDDDGGGIEVGWYLRARLLSSLLDRSPIVMVDTFGEGMRVR